MKNQINPQTENNETPPTPVDPHDFINKVILFQVVNTYGIYKGVIREVSKNGFLKIEEIIEKKAGLNNYAINWYNPRDIFILDTLSDKADE